MPEVVRVLLVEDNLDDAVLLQAALEDGGYTPVIQRVESEAALRSALAAGTDLVISDYRLPRFDGMAALAVVRETDPDLPFILVSGAVGEEIAAEVMRRGAGDFVLKGHLARLAPAVRRELQEAENRRRRRQVEERERRMLYTIAHDLRAPATVISGRLQLILELLGPRATNAMLQENMAALCHALDRMNRMIDDLTQVASLDALGVPLHCTPVALPVFLPMLLTTHADLVDPARVTLDLPDDLPAVQADVAMLERILLNLLINAQKFSPPGTPIVIEARIDGPIVRLGVIDRGQGIPPEDLPHIFGRFYRAEYLRQGEGIGLGLYIVQVLVAAHGGHVWVESETGQGSAFYFTLPVAAPAGA